MENAAEALKIAAWLLIFIVALSIGINSVSQTRQTMDTILAYNDKEYEYTYVEENKSTQRIVGYESIIPAIYKAYQENYKIIFPFTLYKTIINGSEEEINYIDLSKESLASSTKEKFIENIIYGAKTEDSGNNATNFPNIKFFEKNSGNSLYDKIKGKKFIEKLGVYYQEETKDADKDSNLDANKTKKRVVTYEEYK